MKDKKQLEQDNRLTTNQLAIIAISVKEVLDEYGFLKGYFEEETNFINKITNKCVFNAGGYKRDPRLNLLMAIANERSTINKNKI